MKKLLFVFTLSLFVVAANAQPVSNRPALIPEPVSLVIGTGVFKLPLSPVIQASDPASLGVAELLKSRLAAATGNKVSISSSNHLGSIHFILNKKPDTMLGTEGYRLTVTTKEITIRANQPAGLFYGCQTVYQLLPREIESKVPVKNINWQLPCVQVIDYPRFGWRGLMFDVSRHFFSKQDVKDFIDQMVKYKYNLLHMHLTDDEGWRVEIKSLPRLTEVGAWSVKRVGTFGRFSQPTPDEPKNYGGFYTQDDIRELVRYAQDRFVNILPEVDVPGHSLAAVVSYPDLSCTPGADTYHVRAGEKIINWTDSGQVALQDNTLCPANEKVYEFLDKVFTEIAALFPFEYIHIGGDECSKNFWKKSAAITDLMQKEGLKTMEEVQSYFEKRIGKIIESKGKKFIGWDEILEGGLPPNALVMSWRGIKGGIAAAKAGHQVVMSPDKYVYLDYMQSDRVIEPPVYASLRLKTCYGFEPVPDSVEERFILGGQGNLWTEQVYNTRHVQYMVWPRAFAISETFWSPKEKKNWDDFASRVESHFTRFDEAQIKYARGMFDPIFKPRKTDSTHIEVELSSELSGLDIYYSFDNSNPDNFYPKYSTPLSIPKDASMLKAITYRNGKPIGRQIDMPIDELQKRANRKNPD